MTDHRVLPYGRQDIDEDDVQAVVECLRGDWLTQGPRVAEFEAGLARLTGAKHAVAVSSGTAALHLVNLALGIPPGAVGVTSAITFVASANAIRYVGGTVAFADVEPDSGLIDISSLEAVVDALVNAGRAPSVVVAVDYSGQPADLPAVRAIARRCGAVVVEDAAHSLGAEYLHDGEVFRAGGGAHADAAILSFHPVKHITTGEGGAVLTDDDSLAARLFELRSHGIHRDPARMTRNDSDPFWGPWYHEQAELGFHYRISDLQCALGTSQLRRFPAFIERRRAIARSYDEAINESPLAGRLAPLRQHAGRRSSYHLYVARLLATDRESDAMLARRRRVLYEFLRRRDIITQVHYIPVPWQPYYVAHSAKAGLPTGDFPGARRFYASCLSLPLFPSMSDGDVERVIGALGDWARGRE